MNTSKSHSSYRRYCLARGLFAFLFIFTACSSKPIVTELPVEIEPAKEELKICFVGDTGHVDEPLYLVIRAMYKSNCSHVVVLGDLVYGKGWPISKGLRSADDEQFNDIILQPWKKIIGSDIKVLAILGNHDNYGKEKSWFELHNRYDWLYAPDRNWFYSIGDVCIAGFDPVKKDQAKMFFESIDWTNCTYKIMASHYPYKSAGKHGDAKRSKKKLIEKYVLNQADAYFAGHDHNISYEGKVGKTDLLVSGSGSKIRGLRKNHGAPFAISEYGYILATFKEDGVVYDFKDVDNNTMYSVEDSY